MKKGFIVITFLFILCNRSLAQQSIYHLVLFKLKPGISKEDQRFVKAVKLLDALPVEIPEIQDFRAGLNFSDRPIAVDYGLMVLLSDEKSLKKYIEHPAHQAVACAWREIADWNIVDFWAPVLKSTR